MFGVALRRSACVKQQILPNQKTVALIFSDNQIRLRSNRKGDACCREGIDQTILGADCKDVKDASPEKNFPNFDCCAPLGVQPPNYDPYRIKVPDYAVPPLPPSSAKWMGVLNVRSDQNQPPHQQDFQSNQSYTHQQQQQQQDQQQQQQSESECCNQQQSQSQSVFGKLLQKLKNAFRKNETRAIDEHELHY